MNYLVALNKKKRKVLHVNNMKRYVQKEVAVLRMVVVGHIEFESDERKLGGRLQERSDLYVEKDIDELKDEFPHLSQVELL